MTCIQKEKYLKELAEYAQILGSEDLAYAVLCANNGYTLDKTPEGKDSILYNTLLEHFKDANEAIRAKAKTYSLEFARWFGNWANLLFEDEKIQSGLLGEISKVVDKNGEPLVVYNGVNDNNRNKRYKYYTNSKTEAIGYSSGLLTKGGQFFANNKDIIYAVEQRLYELGTFSTDLDSIYLALESISHEGEEIEVDDLSDTETDVFGGKKVIGSHKEIYHAPFTKEEIEQINTSYDILTKNKEAKELLEIIYLINATTLKDEYDLMRQYDDSDYIESLKLLDILLDKHKETINRFKQDYIPDVEAVFINIKNPYVNEINLEDLLYNGRAYANNNDGAFLMGGDHYLIYNETYNDTNQIKYITYKDETDNKSNNGINYNLKVSKDIDPIKAVFQILNEKGLVVKIPNKDLYFIKKGRDDINGRTRIEIENICEKNNISATFTERENATQVKFAPVSIELKDEIDRQDRTITSIVEISSIFTKAFPQIKHVYIINKSDIPAGVKKDANAFLMNNCIYFVKDRVTPESAIEEFLHLFVNTILQYNIPLFSELFDEASKCFPKLRIEIWSTYTNKRGFNDMQRANELVTLALSRKSLKTLDENKRKSIRKVLNKLWNWIARGFQRALSVFGNTVEIDPTKLPKMTLQEVADLVTAEDVMFATQFDAKKYGTAQHSLLTDKVAKSITKQFNTLLRAYEKMPNKSLKRQLILNKIFELYNKLLTIQDVQAVDIALDFMFENIGAWDILNNQPTKIDSVSGWLWQQKQLAVPYENVTPDELVYIWQNVLGFYENLITNTLPSINDDSLTPGMRLKIESANTLLISTKTMWLEAMLIVGDRIVDRVVNEEVSASLQDKEDMKVVAKDYLHKNIMYGDISGFEMMCFNNGYSTNPIIKQAFHLIQQAETQTLSEIHPIATKLARLYRKADSIGKHLGYSWQTILMEYDKEGIPTGNFVRPINYGQYQKDIEDFIKQLNDDFIKTYGHTYIDDDGIIINSLTHDNADEETWGDTGNDYLDEPVYIKYLKEIELKKCLLSNRRYTEKYYLERLSRPYSGSLDPLTPGLNPSGHGLSPKTLSRYNHIQTNINYYLDKCTDKETGFRYPENLNSQDKRSLDMWRDELDKLSNPFNEDGSIKTGEDLQAAYEIRAWEKWVSDNSDTEVDLDEYNKELSELTNEAQQTGNYSRVRDFIKYNSRIGINPDFFKLTFGTVLSVDSTDPKVIHANLLRQSLQGLVKDKNSIHKDLQKMLWNPAFWLNYRNIDQIIEDGKSTLSPEFAKMIDDNYTFEDILYRDAYGFAIDSNGNQVKPEDEKLHADLRTFFDYIVDEYTNKLLNDPSHTIPGLIDQNGNQIVISGTAQQVKTKVLHLFSYKKKIHHSDGTITIEWRPCTIFSSFVPKENTFFNTRTNRIEYTILQVPTGRFSKKTSNIFMNSEYDPNDTNAELPKVSIYDNSSNFDKLQGPVLDLYNALIEEMEKAINMFSMLNHKFNYSLPLINANVAQLVSRITKNGFKNTAALIFEAMHVIEENDESMRTADDYVLNPDGSIANDVPLKYIRRLKDPSTISTDITSSVIFFINMALNYKNKNAILAQLKTLRYNLDDNLRAKAQSKDEFKAVNNENSAKMFDSMMNKHVYMNLWNVKANEGPISDVKIAWQKAMSLVQKLETKQMLAWNLLSMLVGGGDAASRILKESIACKYLNPLNLIKALYRCLYYTPALISNIGNPVPNSKFGHIMQRFGISRKVSDIYSHMNWHARRVFNPGTILMGGFSMIDYMSNSFLLMANIDNIKFYDGGVIPTGFYTLYELILAFKNAGYSTAKAISTHIFSTTSLWDAFENDGNIKSKYELYVTNQLLTKLRTKTEQRAALINGMNPDNDTPMYTAYKSGQAIAALRKFILQQYQHLAAGGTDNIVRNVTETDEEINKYDLWNRLKGAAGKHKMYDVKGTTTKRRTKVVIDPLTEEQKARRMSWNYETGTPNDQVIVGMYRAFNKFCRKLWVTATNRSKSSNIKFSPVEKYAWRDALIYLSILAAQMIAWPLLNEWASGVEPPKDREEAGTKTWYNPIDYINYISDVWIPNGYYKLMAADLGFRIIESLITNIDPFTVMDVVNSIVALKSGVDEHIAIFKAGADLLGISGKNIDDEINRGGYKFYTRGERVLYKFMGPVDNLHTFLSYNHLKSNMNFYTNMYGGAYRFVGYDFSHENDKKNKNNSEGLDLGLDLGNDLDLNLDLDLGF